MQIYKNNNPVIKKKCARPGCNNLIAKRAKKEYCSSPSCAAIRDFLYDMSQHKKEKDRQENNINLCIPKNIDLIGKSLTIRCSVIGKEGQCIRTFTVPYNLNRKWYPNFCEEHRNEYRRKRFQEGRSK